MGLKKSVSSLLLAASLLLGINPVEAREFKFYRRYEPVIRKIAKKEMITRDYASLIAKLFDEQNYRYNLDAEKLKKYLWLGFDHKDYFFHETEKPNAVIVYPVSDGNAERNAFYNPESKRFLKHIMRNYDTQVIIADCNQDVYEAIDKVPNIELLVLAGHGQSMKLALADGNNLIIDAYFLHLLEKLASDAVIYLNSCLNGNGKQDAINLANFIALSGRKVISSTQLFKISDVSLKNIYPLDLKVIRLGVDCTYKPKCIETKLARIVGRLGYIKACKELMFFNDVPVNIPKEVEYSKDGKDIVLLDIDGDEIIDVIDIKQGAEHNCYISGATPSNNCFSNWDERLNPDHHYWSFLEYDANNDFDKDTGFVNVFKYQKMFEEGHK